MKTLSRIIVIALTFLFLGLVIRTTSALAVLPKPDTLVGPTEEQQKTEAYTKNGGYGANTIIPVVTKFSIGFAGIMAFVALVYGGLLYVISYGDETQTGKAKKIIIWSIVGLLIAMFSYAIISTLVKFKVGP